ncbi:MAG: hypothetical protein JWP97_708 [Labilithrix sp.]|nr:hypothetical protein [Labilithrix sp.]
MRYARHLKVVGLLAAASTIVAGVSLSRTAKSADHRDSPATAADPAGDINDVYTWMDGSNYVMAMTVFPFADATSKFSDQVQYVFHTTSGTAFGETKASSDVICTFDAAQKASCWVGSDDYVTGVADVATGISSTSGKTKVFAGRREDPFFFNLTGFKAATKFVEDNAGTLAPLRDDAGCFNNIDPLTRKSVTDRLAQDAGADGGPRASRDDFATAQGLAIVVSVDKTLITKGGPVVSVWASTNTK